MKLNHVSNTCHSNIYHGLSREKERETKRQRERKRERQRDKERERVRERERERERKRERERERERERNGDRYWTQATIVGVEHKFHNYVNITLTPNPITTIQIVAMTTSISCA